jgi:hypothetical protein
MKLSNRRLIWAVIATVLSGVVYLLAAQSTLRLGFPLDDAWIHQTYARNLGESGEWSFVQGEASAGSTAPLWSSFLGIAYLFKLDPLVWTYLAGLATLALTGWLGSRWLAYRVPSLKSAAWIVALILPLEWHLAWASVSGMETIALGGLALLIFTLLDHQPRSFGLIGFLIGLGLWLRPDALLLVIAPLGTLLLSADKPRSPRLLRFAAGLVLPLILYGAFQRSLSGSWWPNTFFAKQAEYAALTSAPIVARYLVQLGIPGQWIGLAEFDPGGPLVGVLVVLLPGLVIAAGRHITARNWRRLLPLAWCLAHIGAYALRLPVTYQHGRYAIPVIPTLIILSAEGMLGWVDLRAAVRPRRMLSLGWLATAALITLAFWSLGARAYARDVAIIESEMVEAARWINVNTPQDSVVAVHDIGAIGYFGDRALIDLAGLVTPEVIPILRNEAALASYLDQQAADYLITFPGWYPDLVTGLEPAFVTGGMHSPQAGGENMAIYRWN